MILHHPFQPTPMHWRALFLLLFLLSTQLGRTQELHSSQWTPMMGQLHPALTGPGQGRGEIGGRHRAQWASIASGYRTSQVYYHQQNGAFAWGAQAWQQQTEEGNWQRTGGFTQVAYHKQLDDRGSCLSVGTSIGLVQHRLGIGNSYDQQYVEGQGYDPSLASGETSGVEGGQRTQVDWQVGTAWQGPALPSGERLWQVAATAAHLHHPDISLDEKPLYWAPRWSLSGSWSWGLSTGVVLSPEVMYQWQGKQAELQWGARLGFSCFDQQRAWIGLHHRWQDAGIVQLGWQQNNLKLWLSYDWNTSALKMATPGQGSLELGASFGWAKRESKATRLRGEAPLEPLPQVNKVLDTDGDGVPDELDRCPLVVGLAIYHGCDDRDQDGVIDPDDSCPELFGYRDQHGCPWQPKDSDLDGVPDEADYCIFIKGDPALHGCPDTDGDGVSDIDDHCPYLKGTIAGKGCPDPLTTNLKSEPSSSVSDTPILFVEFDFDKTIIIPTFEVIMQDVAQQKLQQPRLKLLITGHADHEGDTAYNYQLGLARAQAVWAYLAPILPADAQAELTSYGELMPLSSNQSATGRARNRRVEVRIIR